jgi:hypothetical protein
MVLDLKSGDYLRTAIPPRKYRFLVAVKSGLPADKAHLAFLATRRILIELSGQHKTTAVLA